MMIATPAKPAAPRTPAPRPAPPAVHPLRPFRALFLKELREHWPYPVLGWTLWGFLAAFIDVSLNHNLLEPVSWNILGSTEVQTLTLLSAAAIGLWIGLATTLSNRRFDTWAILTHRPVSRSWLFAARISAGLTLYALAIGVPFLVLLFAATTRAAGALFVWPMAYPVIADFLLGALAYLTAFLVGDRHARLLGSRAIPLILAAALLIATRSLPHFTTVLIIDALAAILLTLAAWGSLLSHGYQLPRAAPLPARLALRLLFLIAFSLPLALALPVIRNSLTIPAPRTSATSVENPVTTLFLTRTGQIVVLHNGATRSLADLQGHALPASTLQTVWNRGVALERPYESNPSAYRDFSTWITPFFVQGSAHPPQTPERWFYVHPQGVAYGYDYFSQTFLGTLGQSGFAAAGAPRPTPFDHAHALPDHPFAFPDAVYDVDFAARTVHVAWTPPAGEHLLAINTADANHPSYQGGPPLTVYATEHHLYIFISSNASPTVIPFDFATADSPILYQLTDNAGWVTRTTDPPLSSTNPAAATYRFYDAAGQFQRQQQVTASSTAPLIDPNLQPLLRIQHIESGILTGLLSPPTAMLTAVIRPSSSSFVRYWPAFLTGLIPAAILIAFLTFRLAKRRRAPHPIRWSLLALATGPAAALALLATHEVPRTED